MGLDAVTWLPAAAAGTQLLVIREDNGPFEGQGPPSALLLTEGQPSTVAIPSIPLRITDATPLNDDGVFHAIQYFWPGEPELFPPEDTDFVCADKPTIPSRVRDRGKGEDGKFPIEQLLELRYSSAGVSCAGKPVSLDIHDPRGRNWEGIADWRHTGKTYGWLLVADEFSTYPMAYVASTRHSTDVFGARWHCALPRWLAPWAPNIELPTAFYRGAPSATTR